MPKLILGCIPVGAEKNTASLLLGILIVLLNTAFFPNMTFPADEGKWLLLQIFAPGLALFFLTAAIIRQQKIDLRISTFQVCLLLFFAWAAASGSWALNRVSFPAGLMDMASLVIILLFFSVALRNQDQRLPVFFLGLYSTMVSTVGVLQYFGLDGDLFHQYVKPASFFVNKNYASPIVAASLPLLGMTLLSGKAVRSKLPLLAVFQINFAYLLISGTKSSWIAYFGSMTIFTATAFNLEAYRNHFTKDFLIKNLWLIASGVALSLGLAYIHAHGPFPAMFRELLPQSGVVLILTSLTALSPLLLSGLLTLWRHGANRHRLLPHLTLLVLASGAILFILTRPLSIVEEIQSSLSVNSTVDPMLVSWSARIPLWLNSLAIILDHPIHGVGICSLDAAYPLYHKALMNDLLYTSRLWLGGAHNEPLQLMAELGLVGLILAAACFVMINRYYQTLLKSAAPATVLLLTGSYFGIVALVLESLFNPVFHQPSTLFLLAFFSGAIHSALYRDEHTRFFIFRREIPVGSLNLYLAPLAVLFFLMLSVGAPLAMRRYQAFVNHREAIALFSAKRDDDCYVKLREAVNKWPYSSMITIESAAESYLYLLRHFNEENLRQAREDNRQALRALPYHYNTNLIRIALLKYSPGGRTEINKYAPLLLKVTPEEKLEEARREINY